MRTDKFEFIDCDVYAFKYSRTSSFFFLNIFLFYNRWPHFTWKQERVGN